MYSVRFIGRGVRGRVFRRPRPGARRGPLGRGAGAAWVACPAFRGTRGAHSGAGGGGAAAARAERPADGERVRALQHVDAAHREAAGGAARSRRGLRPLFRPGPLLVVLQRLLRAVVDRERLMRMVQRLRVMAWPRLEAYLGAHMRQSLVGLPDDPAAPHAAFGRPLRHLRVEDEVALKREAEPHLEVHGEMVQRDPSVLKDLHNVSTRSLDTNLIGRYLRQPVHRNQPVPRFEVVGRRRQRRPQFAAPGLHLAYVLLFVEGAGGGEAVGAHDAVDCGR
ncbi:glycosyltransferases involved in cell wall biogenesis [Babesia caballi]|uniref:Glycosyltransferases involved in cell wall biogenesis n=1 Tax=Babesia caballi TaxID=5871 RepID=A0AAV4LLW4_BABCB|nr:glycosyltransferases involved in cell wall biogenesis [Babesia caballi]